MKVSLINNTTYLKRNVPLGLGYVASYLINEGHDVSVYDPPPYRPQSVEAFIKQEKPEIVAFNCSTHTYPHAVQMAQDVKKIIPEVKIAVGGVHPSVMPKETIAQSHGALDFSIMEEGELTMAELCEKLEKGGALKGVRGLAFQEKGLVTVNEKRPMVDNLDILPMPARHLFPMHWYTRRCTSIRGMWLGLTNLIASRGCYAHCTFCGSHTVLGRKMRYHSISRVLDEMEYLIDKYKVEALLFNDDTFNADVKRVMLLCKGMRERKIEIKWHCQCRTIPVTDGMVEAMAKAGCIQVSVGAESGSDKVLKNIKKGALAKSTYDSLTTFNKHGIRTLANWIVGLPGESWQEFQKTLDLAVRTGADYNEFYLATPYPGTELWDQAIKNGWVKTDLSLDKFQHGDWESSVMEIDVPFEELKKMQAKGRGMFVKGKIADYIKNPIFLKDAFLISVMNPSLYGKIIGEFFRGGGMEKSLRHFEEVQRARSFP